MNEPIRAYPLQWPIGWKRATSRRSGRFSRHGRSLSVADGVERVLEELSKLGVGRDDVVISTNMPTRMDGLPRSDRAAPGDPGVAVYWQDRKRRRQCIAVDLYSDVADNLGAVAATLDAMRSIERHGGAQVQERAFTGFAALPAPGATATRTWRQVLEFEDGCVPEHDTVRIRYRSLRSERHPDKEGGTDAAFAEVERAWTEYQEETGR